MEINLTMKQTTAFIILFAERQKMKIDIENIYYNSDKKMTMLIKEDGNQIPLINLLNNDDSKIKTADPIKAENINNDLFYHENGIKTAVAREHNMEYNNLEFVTLVEREKDNFKLSITK